MNPINCFFYYTDTIYIILINVKITSKFELLVTFNTEKIPDFKVILNDFTNKRCFMYVWRSALFHYYRFPSKHFSFTRDKRTERAPQFLLNFECSLSND